MDSLASLTFWRSLALPQMALLGAMGGLARRMSRVRWYQRDCHGTWWLTSVSHTWPARHDLLLLALNRLRVRSQGCSSWHCVACPTHHSKELSAVSLSWQGGSIHAHISPPLSTNHSDNTFKLQAGGTQPPMQAPLLDRLITQLALQSAAPQLMW